MRATVAVLAAALALMAPLPVAQAAEQQAAQGTSPAGEAQAPAEQETTRPAQEGDDDTSGPPIWALIGLMLLAAAAGTAAARARNRRRMRGWSDR